MSNDTSDKKLQIRVTPKLTRGGLGSQSHVRASVRSGDVTLTGTLRYGHERRAVIRSASGVRVVRRVVDQMQVEGKKKGWA